MKTYPDPRPQSAVNNWHTWSVLLCTTALVGLTGFASHLDGVDAPQSGHPAKQSAPAPTDDSAAATDTDDSNAPIPDTALAMKCAQCGVVSSLREIAGSEISSESIPSRGNLRKTYEVTVHLRDGSKHVFREIGSSIWRVGERMIVIGGV